MFKTSKIIADKGYDVVYAINSYGKVTKAPKLFVCPACLAAAAKFTDNETLQRKAAKHVVMGTKGDTKVVLCAKCRWAKTNLTTPEEPKKTSKAATKKKIAKKPAKKAAAKKTGKKILF